jgi:phenylpyruvate tautomerase PptA (4-oxalocrotonate tautomerase family)
MPMIFIEGPPGLSDVARRKMIADVTRAADDACHVPDVRLWLREYPPERYAQDGAIGAPVRPIATLEAQSSATSRRNPPWWSGSTPHSPRHVKASQIRATSWAS